MGETLEENWVLSGSDDSSTEETEVNVSVEENRKEDSSDRKRRMEDVQVELKPKLKKKRGMRSISKEEDADLLSSTPGKIAESFWNFYTKAMKESLTKRERDVGLPPTAFIACRNEVGWKDCSIIVKAGLVNWKKRITEESLKPRSPRVLVVSGSANRALELIRELRSLECFIGKLFSRHIKLKIIAEILNQNEGKAVPIGVGTPGRILKLLEFEHMNLDGTELLIVDMSRDLKGYNVVEQMDSRKDFCKLFSESFVQKIRLGSMKVAVYL